jgi:hypothetical protein
MTHECNCRNCMINRPFDDIQAIQERNRIEELYKLFEKPTEENDDDEPVESRSL